MKWGGFSTVGGNNAWDCSYQRKWFFKWIALLFLQLLSFIKCWTQDTVKKWTWKSKLKFYNSFLCCTSLGLLLLIFCGLFLILFHLVQCFQVKMIILVWEHHCYNSVQFDPKFPPGNLECFIASLCCPFSQAFPSAHHCNSLHSTSWSFS